MISSRIFNLRHSNLLLVLFTLLLWLPSYGQAAPELDKSPLDMAYFPDNFAHDRKPGQNAVARVIYSRPRKGERAVFGKLVPYGEIWRTGANEATEIKFYQDVIFGGKKVKAGTYSLFTIPGEKEWTIILNTDLDYWGAYSYNPKRDVVRVTAPVTQSKDNVEHFSIAFGSKGAKSAVMKMAWENTAVEMPFSF
jgi:hypothetical protein